jgi:hypothetical protein
VSEQVPGAIPPEPSIPADQAPTVQQPVAQHVPEAAVSYAAPPVAEQAKRGTYVPKWVAALAAVVVVGLGGFAIGKATSNETSDSRPAGFSPSSGQQSDGSSQQAGGQGGFSGQGGFGGQGGSSQNGANQGGSSQGGSTQGGFGQNGPMTRSGGS